MDGRSNGEHFEYLAQRMSKGPYYAKPIHSVKFPKFASFSQRVYSLQGWHKVLRYVALTNH